MCGAISIVFGIIGKVMTSKAKDTPITKNFIFELKSNKDFGKKFVLQLGLQS